MKKLQVKKVLLAVLAVLVSWLLPFLPYLSCVQAAQPQKITVVIDGKTVAFPDQAPYIKDGRTMVPVRAPMEAIGCTVSWDEAKQQAIITKGSTTAIFTIGSTSYTVNGQVKTMDVAAEITGNRTSFPLRFAAEAMGATVGWDASTYTVSISTTGQTTPQPCMKAIVKKTTLGNDVITDILPPVGLDRIKVICTSNQNINSRIYTWPGEKPVTVDMTKYTSDYTLFRDGYSQNPQVEESLVFDIYAKINGTEEIIDTVPYTVPQ